MSVVKSTIHQNTSFRQKTSFLIRQLLALALIITLASCSANEASAKIKLSGTFIQLNNDNAAKPAEWWHAKIERMSEIGLKTIIIQYVAFQNTSFYPIGNKSLLAQYRQINKNRDPINYILEKADDLGMRVFIGLNLETDFKAAYDADNEVFVFDYDKDAIISRSKKMLLDLFTRYVFSNGRTIHGSFSGWYLPIELNDAVVTRTPQAKFMADLISYYYQLSTYAHQQTDFPTMISPFFAADTSFNDSEPRNPRKYADWWNEALQANKLEVDIVAFQDSIGAGHLKINGFEQYLNLLEPIFQKHDVELWINNEAFRIRKNRGFESAEFKDFLKQLEAGSKYTDTSIMFEFLSYMSGPGSSLYDAYKHYLLSTE